MIKWIRILKNIYKCTAITLTKCSFSQQNILELSITTTIYIQQRNVHNCTLFTFLFQAWNPQYENSLIFPGFPRLQEPCITQTPQVSTRITPITPFMKFQLHLDSNMTENDDVWVSESFTFQLGYNISPFPTVSPIGVSNSLLPPQKATSSKDQDTIQVVLFLYHRLFFSSSNFLEMHCLPCLREENVSALESRLWNIKMSKQVKDSKT